MSEAEGLVAGQSHPVPGRHFPFGQALGTLRRLRTGLAAPGRVRAVLLYASMPGLSAVNALVGLLLPMLLGPAEFGHYALVVTMFQYGLILDFGLAQLADRRLPPLAAAGKETAAAAFANRLLWARLYVAATVLPGAVVAMAVLDGAGRLPFPLLPGALSLAAGLLFMLALGPMTVWRATARREAFARWSMACGLVLAVGRPVGLLLGGLPGCFGLMALGYGALAGRLGFSMPLRRRDRPGLRATAALLAAGVPLFATSFVWAFYMTANRWVVSWFASGTELGQFAFGANVVTLLVGAVAALSQLHYPALVAQASRAGPFGVSHRAGRELCLLVAAMAVPTVVGIVLGPHLIRLLYPGFAGSVGPVRALMTAVPALVLASWLMPLSLSVASRPWIEGMVVYPSALAVLTAATALGFRAGGIEGAGWGLVVSSLPLLAMQLTALRLVRLLRGVDVLRVLATAGLCTAASVVVAVLF